MMFAMPAYQSCQPQHQSHQPAPPCAIVDIEALVTKNVVIVEQIGIIIMSNTRCVLHAQHIIVRQPDNVDMLAQRYKITKPEIEKAIYGYQLVTGDDYIHPDGVPYYKARSIVLDLIRRYGATVWAKGATLERRVFGSVFNIYDLEDFGCPKYPYGYNHNPLNECMYFAQFVPQALPY